MTAPELRPVILSTPDRVSIHKLFAAGYGDSYKAHVVDRYLGRATKVPALVHATGSLAAAALLENGRIAGATTTTDRQLGNRISMGSQIMALSREEGATWMSVGDKHRGVQIGARAIGMERVNDVETVLMLLEQNNVSHEYDISQNPKGELLVAQNGAEVPYEQQIWAWPEAHIT